MRETTETEGAAAPAEPEPLALRHEEPEAKTIAALERIGEALRALQWHRARRSGLTPLQARLLELLLHRPEAQPRAIAAARYLGVSRATVAQAVAALEAKGLLQRRTDPADGRAQRLVLTPRGITLVAQWLRWAEPALQALRHLPEAQRGELLAALLQLVLQLQHAGIVQGSRMCLSCRFYRERSSGAYCELMQAPLRAAALRLECPEHEPAPSEALLGCSSP